MELSGEGIFKRSGRKIVKRLMNTASVVEKKIPRDGISGFRTGSEVLSVGTFGLYGLEKRFSTGVVIGSARTAHALKRAAGGCFAPEIPRGILATPISMDYKALVRTPCVNSVSEGLNSQVTVDRITDGPADYTTAEKVYECAKVQPAFIRRNVGKIGHPCSIRQTDTKILPEKVGKYRRVGVGNGRSDTPAPYDRYQTCAAHQSANALAAGINSLFTQLLNDLAGSVNAVALIEDVLDMHRQMAISLLNATSFALLILIVSLSAHFQQFARSADG